MARACKEKSHRSVGLAMRQLSWVLLLLASCAAAPLPLPPPPPAQQRATKPGVVAKPEATLVTSGAPLRDVDASGVKLTPYAQDVDTVTMSRNHTYVVVHRRNQLELRVGTESRQIPVRASTRVRISDDEAHLLVKDEAFVLHVFSLPDATRQREIPDVGEYDVAGDTLVYQTHKCELFSVSLRAPTRSQRLGKECGTVLGLAPDKGLVLLGESSELQAMHSRGFATLALLNFASGVRDEIVNAADERSFLSTVAVSRDVSRLCYLVDLGVNCTETDQPELVVIQGDPVMRGPFFDSTGKLVTYVTREKLGAPERLFLASTVTGAARELQVEDHEWWEFLPGDERLVGHGGERRFSVVDLRHGWRMELGEPTQEYEGLALVPGDPTRFFIGRERDAVRDMVLVELGR